MDEEKTEITKEDLEAFEVKSNDIQLKPEESKTVESKQEELDNRKVETQNSAGKLKKVEEENEILRIQLLSREREIGELQRELDDIHSSISYKVGRWIAETSIGRALKSFLRKYFFK